VIGILGDVDGRIVPVAPPPISLVRSAVRTQSYHLLEEHWVPIASCEHYSNEKARFLNRAPCEAVFQAVTGAGSTPSWASIVIWSK
jgi:hypothetical protein